ncbi:tRNA (adenosine(37)-N6)-threonylcarbamoyltransferase complex transferase subunit TsaD [soil metagenome]
MILLGIETSCDETSAALLEVDQKSKTITSLLSQTTATSLSLHAKTGGIIPEIAARAQLAYMLPVLEETFAKGLKYKINRSTPPPIDAICVTYGPGLIGSLLVGVETARTLSYLWNIPLIPVNHLYGHIYANWLPANLPVTDDLRSTTINFPAIALIVSGGHTDLLFMKSHTDIQVIGGARDDAAGEAFDKIGRLLGFTYPAGPEIEKRATLGDPKTIRFPRPLIGENTYDFSFSGLKTAVYRHVQTIEHLDNETINNLCASVQEAIIDVLIKKTLKAAQEYQVKAILLGGGVAANGALTNQLHLHAKRLMLNVEMFVPQKSLCTDNAAMIAAAGFFQNQQMPWQEITPNPELYFL